MAWAPLSLPGIFPRVCGEKSRPRSRRATTAGSPPRVRGKARTQAANCVSVRITPACAGKSCVFSHFAAARRDHPRVCGEKETGNPYGSTEKGSPPRVRGKVGLSEVDPSLSGITPACAGKRFPHSSAGSKPQDHPRVCGEKSYFSCLLDVPTGSPPRVRGKVVAYILS